MTAAPSERNHRILVIDDTEDIHKVFRRVLGPKRKVADLGELESSLFGGTVEADVDASFEIDAALQGQLALEMVRAALTHGRPYSTAFVDMRMPPGWDGLETIQHLWAEDPDLEIVICTAFSDYTDRDIVKKLGPSDQVLFLRKPFETIEVRQLARALTEKWTLRQQSRLRMAALERAVATRTAELEQVNLRLSAELAHRDRMEAELRLAHRLEAIGQLAAGVAHEINTPLQYVSDNLTFVGASATTLIALAGQLEELVGDSELHTKAVELTEAADLGFLAEKIPDALDNTSRGLGRVSKIVRAMNELGQPGSSACVPTDLNHCLQNALEMTAGVYKHVADVEVELGELPPVTCLTQELNQVFLNLIVNAAHAVEDQGRRGVIGVKSRVDGETIVISISDTGCGILDRDRDRIFDPFFTTKEVGRGQGQGLAISRSIVVDHHHGALTFETAVGHGTTFHVRLPIHSNPPALAG